MSSPVHATSTALPKTHSQIDQPKCRPRKIGVRPLSRTAKNSWTR
ncbi:hypothetical protein [Kitasatospora cineracea]|nr:hypothetical protein [Kitasatospora cineracea]